MCKGIRAITVRATSWGLLFLQKQVVKAPLALEGFFIQNSEYYCLETPPFFSPSMSLIPFQLCCSCLGNRFLIQPSSTRKGELLPVHSSGGLCFYLLVLKKLIHLQNKWQGYLKWRLLLCDLIHMGEDVEWYFAQSGIYPPPSCCGQFSKSSREACHFCRKAQKLFVMETLPRSCFSLVRTAFLFPFCTYLNKWNQSCSGERKRFCTSQGKEFNLLA